MEDRRLARIRHLIMLGRYRFTRKADDERNLDGLAITDVLESIMNAPRIEKVIRARGGPRTFRGDPLIVIVGQSYRGVWVYTKGAIRKSGRDDYFYILISSKLSRHA